MTSTATITRATGTRLGTRLGDLALLRAVNRLNAEQRECVLARFWLQLSVAETAAALNLSQVTVRARLYRAMRSLARSVPTRPVPAEGVRR